MMPNPLKAAFGKVLITPEEPVGLQGFDARVNIAHPPNDILDDIFARIIVLDDGNSRSVIVSIDSCMSDEIAVRVPSGSGSGESVDVVAAFPPGTRNSWAKAAGANGHHAAVFATHTHAAPCHFSEKYTLRIEEKIAEAAQSLVPVKLSISEGKSALTAFRRPTLHPNFDVEIDQTLSVILFETEDTKLLGAIVAYAMHPTILHPPAPINRVSRECVGWAMHELEEEIGGGFISLFAQGFSGDVCPILPGCGAGPDTDTYGNVRKAGHDLFLDIQHTMRQRTPIEAARCVVQQSSHPLPVRADYQGGLEMNITGIALGELVLLCASGEIFNGYVAKVQAVSPFKHTIPISMANGYRGYLPTLEAYRDGMGGYEMNTTPYVETADSVFVHSVEDLLRDLYAVSQ